MSPVTNTLDQPMLRGLFVPVDDEMDADGLAVSGSLPAGLAGTFARIGPNPRFEPLGRYHMFDGDGMVHALTFDEGGVRYRNRWVRTPAFLAEERAGRALYGGLGELHVPDPADVGDAGLVKNPANTNLVRHAGRTLALWEGGPPTELTAELDTVGPLDLGGGLASAFTAHPRIDPRTGQLFAFCYQPAPPHLCTYELAADGTVVAVRGIETPACSVMHDFVITEHHLVFVDSPLLFDLVGLLEGRAPFRWDDDHGTRIGVVGRDDGEVRWFEVEDGYVNHFWNAWEDGDTIVMSGSCTTGSAFTVGQGGAADQEGAEAEPGRPTRLTVDLATGRTTKEQFDDLGGDFPRINDAYTGVRSRYHSMGAFRGAADLVGHFDTVVQYDDVTGARADWWAGPGTVVGEPVFAADPDGTEENDGWLLATVHDRATGATDLAVLDAHDVAAGPVARVHVPRRVPYGFHAAWFPAG